MKPKVWIWISCLLSILPLQAQEVAYYECGNSVETYPEGTGLEPVSGFPTEGTDISQYYFTETGAFSYEGTSQVIESCFPIGFDFVFHGEVFDKFIPMGKGYMLLGKKGETGIELPENGNIVLMLDNAIGLSCSRPSYAGSQTQIRYSRSGEAPSRVLTLEYVCLGQSVPENGSCTDYATYYIQLRETDSSIRIHFDTACSANYAARYSIGIKGEDGDVHFRAPGEGNDWSRSVYTTSNTRMANTVFPSGTSYTFSIPPACMEPEVANMENEITLLASDAFEGRIDMAMPRLTASCWSCPKPVSCRKISPKTGKSTKREASLGKRKNSASLPTKIWKKLLTRIRYPDFRPTRVIPYGLTCTIIVATGKGFTVMLLR